MSFYHRVIEIETSYWNCGTHTHVYSLSEPFPPEYRGIHILFGNHSFLHLGLSLCRPQDPKPRRRKWVVNCLSFVCCTWKLGVTFPLHKPAARREGWMNRGALSLWEAEWSLCPTCQNSQPHSARKITFWLYFLWLVCFSPWNVHLIPHPPF